MNPQPRTCLVIPVHNRRATTQSCLRALAEDGVFDWAQVLVVDSGSADGTAEMIAREFPRCGVEHGTADLWWTGAIRRGTERALAEGAEMVVWLNDDCLARPGAVAGLVAAAASRQAVCGGCCFSRSGSFTYGGGIMIGATHLPLRTAPAEVTACDWLNGNLVAIPAAVFRRIGLPEPRWMPQLWGDVEFTYRARVHGFPVLLLPEVQAINELNPQPLAGPWLSHALALPQLWSGWWNRKAWWHLPSIGYFKLRHFRLQGLASLGFIALKMMAATGFRLVVPRPLQGALMDRWARWVRRRREGQLRAHLKA